MAIDIFQVIKGPVVSEKAYKLNQDNKVVLIVHNDANSIMVRQAVEKLFDVKVVKVNMQIRKGKTKRAGRRVIVTSATKRAYVTLAPGYTVNLFDDVARSQSQPVAVEEQE